MEHHRIRPGLSAAPLFLLFAAVFGLAVPAAPQMWPPLTDAQKAVKEAPGQPGAPAVCLYREQTSNHDNWTFSEFRRIKILTPAGKDYGTIEVPFSEAWTVERIRARVIKPDGGIATFTGQIFEKTVLQIGGFKRMVKSFALPDLEVGSIIDYRYDLKLDLEKAASARSISLERWKPEEGGVPDGLSLLSYTTELWDFNAPLYTYK
ncbi:MAG TPA: DUF3857 domain-containing protein, partial [Acidobacteriota bacterium]|nr:DUF3857 domain-containing protein [Acidobacteriota bacterium]